MLEVHHSLPRATSTHLWSSWRQISPMDLVQPVCRSTGSCHKLCTPDIPGRIKDCMFEIGELRAVASLGGQTPRIGCPRLCAVQLFGRQPLDILCRRLPVRSHCSRSSYSMHSSTVNRPSILGCCLGSVKLVTFSRRKWVP